jgi:hypothetical protein
MPAPENYRARNPIGEAPLCRRQPSSSRPDSNKTTELGKGTGVADGANSIFSP